MCQLRKDLSRRRNDLWARKGLRANRAKSCRWRALEIYQRYQRYYLRRTAEIVLGLLNRTDVPPAHYHCMACITLLRCSYNSHTINNRNIILIFVRTFLFIGIICAPPWYHVFLSKLSDWCYAMGLLLRACCYLCHILFLSTVYIIYPVYIPAPERCSRALLGYGKLRMFHSFDFLIFDIFISERKMDWTGRSFGSDEHDLLSLSVLEIGKDYLLFQRTPPGLDSTALTRLASCDPCPKCFSYYHRSIEKSINLLSVTKRYTS